MKHEIKKALDTLFSELGIEYYSSIELEYAKITKPYLIERLDFIPRSVIVFLVPYYSGAAENLSVYAASRDYHGFIKEAGGRICTALSELFSAKSASFSDHSPIDERDAAARCALGILGDNGLLINEKYGSYVFIGEILTDLGKDELQSPPPVPVMECEHCGRCLDACPRGEIGECLSALTQKKGELSDKERLFIKKYGSVWGCDICQSACPHNRAPKITPVGYFKEARTPRVDRAVLSEMSDAEFASRAYSWRGRAVLERNVSIFEDE